MKEIQYKFFFKEIGSRRYALILFLLSLVLSIPLVAQDFPPRPEPAKLVNDFVGVLSSSEIQSLEQKLVSFDDTTSNQIAIVVIKTVEPYDMNTYATYLGREWGIGNEGKDNGIVLLWATEDRKVYIAMGYGLEGTLTDTQAKRVVDRVIIPYFKEARFYEGLNAGTSAIMDYTSGEFEAEPEESEEFPLWAFLLMLLLIFIIIRAISKGGRGGKGGRGLRGGSSAWPYTTYTGWGNQSGNWTGGGGFGGGFGGGGGGGFGGFGGGSFGGGGAGGSY